jgi:hypothetical protein
VARRGPALRCPTGCESWLPPRAVDGHLRPGRCSGEAWVDTVDDSALVPQPVAALLLDRFLTAAETCRTFAGNQRRQNRRRPSLTSASVQVVEVKAASRWASACSCRAVAASACARGLRVRWDSSH